MKKLSYCLLLVCVIQVANAQKIINGNVKNAAGSPLHFVFIHDQKSTTATYTDSLGNFSLSPATGVSLQFELAGYGSEVLTDVQLAANPQVTLQTGNEGGVQGISTTATTLSSKPLSSAYLANENLSSASVSGGTITGLAHQKGTVHGNRYLFDNFVHGFIVSPENSLISSPAYLYDYDKMDGSVMVAVNNGAVSQVNDAQIKTITLVSNDDKQFVLAKMPALDKEHYVQVLASGPRYALYKTIKTTFEKADYVNKGVASHGNDYDEFTDNFNYYFSESQNPPQKLTLKKKTLKTAFAKDADKVIKYLADHPEDLNDTYLEKLGDYLNK